MKTIKKTLLFGLIALAICGGALLRAMVPPSNAQLDEIIKKYQDLEKNSGLPGVTSLSNAQIEQIAKMSQDLEADTKKVVQEASNIKNVETSQRTKEIEDLKTLVSYLEKQYSAIESQLKRFESASVNPGMTESLRQKLANIKQSLEMAQQDFEKSVTEPVTDFVKKANQPMNQPVGIQNGRGILK